MSFVLTVLLAATTQADQTEEPGVQYARDLARVVNQVEQEHVERVTQRQLKELEKKLDVLLQEMQLLRRELNRPSRSIELDPPKRDAPVAERTLTTNTPRSEIPDEQRKFLKYSESIVKKYDENGDQVLVSDEWSRMSRDCSAADTNHDGRISAYELAQFYQQPRAKRDEASQGKQPQVDPRYLKYSTGYIKKYDANDDGVLTKDEWSKMLVDYADADANHDGKITPTEMALLLMKRSGRGGS